MMNKRSQIQLGETIAVVIIIIIILIVGIIFWAQIRNQEVKEVQTESQDLSVIALSKTVAELPELRCYTTEKNSKVNCFDWYKILAMNYTINGGTIDMREQARRYYLSVFGKSKITFNQVYPHELNITVFDYDAGNISERVLRDSVPVVFEYNMGRGNNVKTFGLIIVEGYK